MKSFIEFTSDLKKYNIKTSGVGNLMMSYGYANGCGAKGGIKFPSTMWGVNIETACILHDIRWANAKSYQDLLDANEKFDNDLKKICDQESMNDLTRWLRRMRIAKYVSGVELYGTECYAERRELNRRTYEE